HIGAPHAEFDPAAKGIVVTFPVEEGALYRFGAVDVESHVPDVDGRSLDGALKVQAGAVYDAALVDKTVDNLAITLAKPGEPFAAVQARAAHDPAGHTVGIVFAVEPGTRTYVERINIRGNAKTRDYVIRRELELVEGDAYNRALVERAERRL